MSRADTANWRTPESSFLCFLFSKDTIPESCRGCGTPFIFLLTPFFFRKKKKKNPGQLRILLLAVADISPYVLISVILPKDDGNERSGGSPFRRRRSAHTARAQMGGRCLSALFQLYFSRLRCRGGTCFLDNAVVISPFFRVPLI